MGNYAFHGRERKMETITQFMFYCKSLNKRREDRKRETGGVL